MKSTEIIQPTPISAPIAHEGLKFNIPENATGSELASIAEGFPEITMKALDNGGLPPRGQDCNGMFYLSTDQKVYLQNGGIITFNQAVSDLIGGYPQGAYLDYIDTDGNFFKVKSLIDDNTYNFVTDSTYIDGEKWSEVPIGGTTNASRNIGEKVFSFLPLDDAGLHLLDGSLLEGQGSYRAFVQYIAKLYQNDGGTPPAYFVTEEEYQASITKYGVCAKFVYDSEANTVRLPKVTGIVEGTLDPNALGELVQAGLPNLQLTTASAGAHTHSRGTMNITGNIYSRGNIAGDYSGEVTGGSGAFSQTRKNGPNAVGMKQSTATESKTDVTAFNASTTWTGSTSSNGAHTHAVNVGNTLVGNSDSVQPQTVKGFMYMVVANATKTDIEVDIDNVMTDLNGKADTDLKNLTEAGESHFDSKYLGNNQRTNCLTEIPDRIKYTLNNGTFTLKAGSVIIVPFDTEAPTLTIGDFLEGASNNNNFKIVDIQYKNNQLFYWCEVQNDIVETGSSTGTPLRFIAVTISGSNLENWITWNAKTSSADTLPSDTNSYMWYQPDNNKVVHTDNTTAHNVDRLLSLPFAIVQGGNGYVFNNIYEVFNGMGNIGGIYWVDKGVKGLIPYYRNEDKSLKSINFIQTELTLSTLNRSNYNFTAQRPFMGLYQEDTGCIIPYQLLANNYYYECDVQPNVTNQYAVWYDTYNNIYKTTNDTGATWIEEKRIKLGDSIVNNGMLISSYKNVFQAADEQDIAGIFTYKLVVLAENVKIPKSAVTYNIADYLPNDNNTYEVFIEGNVTTGTTANNYGNLHIGSDIQITAIGVCGARTRTNSDMSAFGSIIVPVGIGRTLTVGANSNGNATYKIRLYGYRKIRG